MKKLLLFLIPFLFITNVFAQDFDVSNEITSPIYNGSNPDGRYAGTEIYYAGTQSTYSINTRYQGRLSKIIYNLPSDGYDEPDGFEKNTTYTITMNMATEDWRNKFGGVSVKCEGSSGTELSNGNVSYISYKKIKFSFKTPSTTYCQFVYVVLSSTNISSVAFTGDTNWNLKSIIKTNPNYSSGGSGSGSSPTPTPSSSSNQDIINNQNNNTENIINNQNNNTQDIIENNNQNTSDIINNQNDLLKSCIKNLIDICNPNESSNSSSTCNGSQLTTNFTANWGMVGWFVNAEPNTTYTFQYDSRPDNYTYARIEEYHNNTLINTVFNDFTGTRKTFTTNSNTNKIRLIFFRSVSGSGVEFNQIQLINSFTISPYIYYDSPVCSNKLDQTTDAINNLNDTMKDDNIDSGVGSDFFEDFTENTHGLSGIITIPLQAIQNLANNQCQTLTIPLPFTESSITLPCMTEYYEEHIPTLYALLQTIIYGFLAYRILIDIFAMVKGFKDPDNDKIEVLDL